MISQVLENAGKIRRAFFEWEQAMLTEGRCFTGHERGDNIGRLLRVEFNDNELDIFTEMMEVVKKHPDFKRYELQMEYFHITEGELEEFTASFIQRLPKYMQEALEYGQNAA